MKMLENSLFLCVKVKVEVLEIKEHRSFWCRDILIIIQIKQDLPAFCLKGDVNYEYYYDQQTVWL